MDWATVWSYHDALVSGLWMTIWLSVVAIAGSTVLGVLVGCLRTAPSFFIPRLVHLYIEAMRNIPVVIKVFFLYFIVGLPAIIAALIGIIAHQSAYIADVTSAGIRSVARGQLDAGLSLGHSHRDVFRYVILPQVTRIVIPPMTTQFVAVIKHTAVVALISVQDLTFETQEINVETFRGFEAATVATVLYVIIAMIVIAGMSLLARKLRPQ